jgi:hypothetical protein
MTQQPEGTPVAPAPGAAPVPASVQPRQGAPAATQPQGDLSARAAQLEKELAAVHAEAAGGDTVTLRVVEPHAEFTYGGVTVRDRPTPVPARALGPLTEAADAAGVKIEEA